MKYWISRIGGICTHYHTRYKRAENTYRKREMHYEDTTAVGIIQEGKIVYINDAMKEKLGCKDKPEIIGKLFLSVVHPESQYEIMNIMERIENGISGSAIQGTFSRTNGSIFTAEFMSFPLLFRGRPAGYIKISDIPKEDNIDFGIISSYKEKFYSILKRISW